MGGPAQAGHPVVPADANTASQSSVPLQPASAGNVYSRELGPSSALGTRGPPRGVRGQEARKGMGR